MKAIVKLRKTGYYVTYTLGEFDQTYLDDEGHMWFSKEIARGHAIRLRGMYDNSHDQALKEVVVGYTEA
jgi:hypothetical protein